MQCSISIHLPEDKRSSHARQAFILIQASGYLAQGGRSSFRQNGKPHTREPNPALKIENFFHYPLSACPFHHRNPWEKIINHLYFSADKFHTKN